MGPKKINSSKEYSSQNSENPKKKIVAAPHNKALPQNLKENTRILKKSATTCSLSVPSHIINTKKSHIPHSQSVKQVKKQIHSNYTDNNPSESNTRSPISLLKKQVNTPKKLIGSGKTASPNRDKIQNANEKVGDAGKQVSKNKQIKKKEDSRLSKPIIHTVALIEDVSKQFKEKIEIRDREREYQMTTLMGGISEGTNSFLTGIFNGQRDIISNPQNNFTMLNEIKITNCNVQGKTKAEIISRDMKVAENEMNYVTDEKLIEDEINKPHQNILTPTASYYNKLSSNNKCRETMNDLNSPDKFGMLEENNVPGTTNDFIGTLLVESNFNSLSYWNPDYYPQTENSMINDDKGIQSGTENMVKNLPKELIFTVKNENPNLTYVTELKHSNTPLNNSEELSKEIKKSVSASTMKSFDRKTYILEKPFDILDYTNESHVVDDISNCKSFEQEKNITFPKIHESSLQNDINTNRIVKSRTDQDVKPERGSIEITNPMTPEKNVVEENSYNAASNFNDQIDKTYEMTELLLRQLLKEEDSFDSVGTLDILNVDGISNNESKQCLTKDILRNFQPNKQSTINNVLEYGNDEFASESEEVLDSLDISKYVWVDYAMPLNTTKLDDGSEIWILDNESSSEEDRSVNRIVFLEPDDQEWIITEKKFEEVKKCLDECRADAVSVSKEVSRLTSKNPNSFSDREKHTNKALRDKSNTIFPNNNENLEQTSNRDKPNQKIPDSALNTSVVEEDLDFYSVSSSDELSDIEKTKISKDVKPQKSFLSFGKSCVKINKKGEKKTLSFFNFFK